MAIKLSTQESSFRNELIFASDAKAVKMDDVLINLFILLNYNGQRPKLRPVSGARGDLDLKQLQDRFSTLEEQNVVSGFDKYPEATEAWLRSNLVNMVNRGRPDKEKIASLRPIHLQSYRLRNARQSRDYNSADQVYLMLERKPEVKQQLKEFLLEGWDANTNQIDATRNLDVDSVGILHLVRKRKPDPLQSSTGINRVKPILTKQADLFCEDITRLLAYKNSIPRSVLLDYIKTIISFHLSLYLQILIHNLPQMLTAGTVEILNDWSFVVDMTGDLDSRISELAIKDTEHTFNGIYDYIKATYKINAALSKMGVDRSDSDRLNDALDSLANRPDDFETYFQVMWNQHWQASDSDERDLINSFSKYEPSFFNKYIELILMKMGRYRYRYHTDLIDNLSGKNDERGFMVQGRSKKHPRRYVMGTRLIEALTQILLLEVENDQFITQSISIEELMEKLRNRYGLVINGIGEERFAEADVNTNLAFRENVEAFKHKLRQIGFYNDLSDAYILQKVRPRYEI